MHEALELLRKIPEGKVTTYKELAEATAAHPRAIGGILRSNTRPRKYPCYRVVMSDGRVGGYAYGTAKKIRLLKRDGIRVDDNRVDLKKHLFKLGSARLQLRDTRQRLPKTAQKHYH